MENVKFVEGKTYSAGIFTAHITKRTPKFAAFTVSKTDDYGWTKENFKRKIETIDNAEGLQVEALIVSNFLGEKSDLTFCADNLLVEVEEVPANVEDAVTVSEETLIVDEDFNFEDLTVEDEVFAALETKELDLHVADCLTAINLVEEHLPAFVIDSNVKILNGIFAKNELGDTMTIFNTYLEVKVDRAEEKSVTKFWFDIPESQFISELKAVTIDAALNISDVGIFSITADNGNVYTYSERTLEVVSVNYSDDSAKTLSPEIKSADKKACDVQGSVKNFIAKNRRNAQYKNLRVLVRDGIRHIA